MGLFDNLVGAATSMLGQNGEKGEGAQNILGNLLQQGAGGPSTDIVGQLLGGLTGGQGGVGMASVLESLAANGLGEQVSSWLSTNNNLPVSPEQIKEALGSEQVQQMAAATGLPIGDFLKHLAEHLPAAASQASGSPTA